MNPDTTGNGATNLVAITALAVALGATPDKAVAIAEQILDEFATTTMNTTSALAVIARVRALTEETDQ